MAVALVATALCAISAALTALLAVGALQWKLRASHEVAKDLREKRYNVLESISEGFYILDERLRFTHLNEHAEELLRRAAFEIVGKRLDQVADPLASELFAEIEQCRTDGQPVERLHYSVSADSWIDVRIQPAANETLVYLRNVSEQRRAEMQLRDSERRLRLLMEQVPALLWTVDRDLCFTSLRGSGLAEQAKSEEYIGRSFSSFFHSDSPDTLDQFNAVFKGRSLTIEFGHGDRWLQNHVEPLRESDGRIVGAVGVALDVTAMKESISHFAVLAHHDTLTGLLNRHALETQIAAMIEAGNGEGKLALCFVDLDHFKMINDTLGHRIGDLVLIAIAKRLREATPAGAVVGRHSGDEFIIVLPGTDSTAAVRALVEPILTKLAEPFDIEGQRIFITASIGVSLYPQQGTTIEALIKHADTAMYRAKESGRNNFQMYDAATHAELQSRFELGADLRGAVARGEFELFYQPVVDTRTRRPRGCEALLRWHHPRFGLVMPDRFIPVAEENGAIVEITDWVLAMACRQAAMRRADGFDRFRIAVNVSARDLYEPDLPERVQGHLEAHGLPGSALELEVTERALLSDTALEALTAINNLGVLISIDDFGVAYSSLNAIKRLPISTLKIDRSFVRDIVLDPFDQAITSAIVTIAKSLSLEVVAEGVETKAQCAFFRKLACDHIQGYYFAKPLDESGLSHYMRESLNLPHLVAAP